MTNLSDNARIPRAGEQIDELVTALKQISDLTGSAFTEDCDCVQCQVHRIAAGAINTMRTDGDG